MDFDKLAALRERLHLALYPDHSDVCEHAGWLLPDFVADLEAKRAAGESKDARLLDLETELGTATHRLHRALYGAAPAPDATPILRNLVSEVEMRTMPAVTWRALRVADDEVLLVSLSGYVSMSTLRRIMEQLSKTIPHKRVILVPFPEATRFDIVPVGQLVRLHEEISNFLVTDGVLKSVHREFGACVCPDPPAGQPHVETCPQALFVSGQRACGDVTMQVDTPCPVTKDDLARFRREPEGCGKPGHEEDCQCHDT